MCVCSSAHQVYPRQCQLLCLAAGKSDICQQLYLLKIIDEPEEGTPFHHSDWVITPIFGTLVFRAPLSPPR